MGDVFKCTLCNTEFSRNKLFMEHMKEKHGFAEAGAGSSSQDDDDSDVEDLVTDIKVEDQEVDEPEDNDTFDPIKEDFDVRMF